MPTHVLVDEGPEALHSFIPSLLSHCESVGSIVMVPTITPVDLSRPLERLADVRDLSEGVFRRSLIDARPEDRQRERLSARDDAVEVEIFQRRMGIAANRTDATNRRGAD